MTNSKTCCLTGYRPQSLRFHFDESNEECIALKEELQKEIIHFVEDFHVTHFMSGMELGVEQYCAEIIINLRKDYPHITLEGVIPYETQAINWTVAQRDRYFALMEQVDKETLLQHHYTQDCMRKRNIYMVKQSNMMLAVWNGRPGGTKRAIECARFFRKTIYIMDPNTMVTVRDHKAKRGIKI